MPMCYSLQKGGWSILPRTAPSRVAFLGAFTRWTSRVVPASQLPMGAGMEGLTAASKST